MHDKVEMKCSCKAGFRGARRDYEVKGRLFDQQLRGRFASLAKR